MPGDTASASTVRDARLAELASLASQLGLDRVSRDIAQLEERVLAGRFHVACIGQFKRGKSTLLNALAGTDVLPTGITPVTTATTILAWGPQPRAMVQYADGPPAQIELNAIADFVAEERNPGNRKAVDRVLVELPSPILENGLCLVDTPGLGSVIPINTRTTRAFLPHIDVALIVIGTDPPLSGEELDLIEEVAQRVDQLILVLNKADRHESEEREVAANFAVRELERRLGRRPGPVLHVSARERLQQRGPPRDWDRLVQQLTSLRDAAGSALVRRAATQGVRRLAGQVLAAIGARRAALVQPVAASQQRLEMLQQIVRDAEQDLLHLTHRFAAEHERVSAQLDRRRNAFLQHAVPAAQQAFQHWFDRAAGPQLRKQSVMEARAIARRSVETWFVEEAPAVEALYAELADRLVACANPFIQRLAASGAVQADALSPPLDADAALRTAPRYYFTELEPGSAPLRMTALRDRLRGTASLRRSLQRSMPQLLQRLIEVNATRIRNDFDDRVLESRRRLAGEVREALRSTLDAATLALDRARELWSEGAEAIAAELALLDRVERRARALSVV